MGIARSYLLRLERNRRRLRSFRKSFQLTSVVNRLKSAAPDAVLLFSTLRNEMPRLAYFLAYYRKLGVSHFCFVDNDSSDGGREYLAAQKDCSVWRASGSYRDANFGMDWLNFLLNRNAADRWTLVVDTDEFLVYSHCQTRPLPALTHWLDTQSIRSFGAVLVDMYPRGPVEETVCQPGDDPFRKLSWFDSGNYTYRLHSRYRNLWIRGGPRQRVYFADQPDHSPALNKIPLVKWQRGYVYVSSTHAMLPRRLNRTYGETGGESPCGCLLHAKLSKGLQEKAIEELARKEHYANSREYKAYLRDLGGRAKIWNEHSTPYHDWRSLEECGLMSAGGWL